MPLVCQEKFDISKNYRTIPTDDTGKKEGKRIKRQAPEADK